MDPRPCHGDILIRKSLRSYINFVFYDNHRIIEVELLQNGDKHLLINTHMPYQYDNNYNMYAEHLAISNNIIDEVITAIISDKHKLIDFGDRYYLCLMRIKGLFCFRII